MMIDDKHEFWEKFNASSKSDNFIVSLTSKIMLGHDLSEHKMEKLILLLYNMADAGSVDEKEVKLKIKKFRKGIPNFLKMVDDALDEAEKMNTRMYKLINVSKERINNLPKLAAFEDSDKVVEFIRSLDKDHYSFSEAAKLLGVSRQSLRKYADENLHGIKIVRVTRSDYITKESMASFFRKKFDDEHSDSLPF